MASDPSLIPNAQNPTLVPNFNPVQADGHGNAFFVNPADIIAQRLPATGTVTLTGSVTTGDTNYIKLTNGLLPGTNHGTGELGSVEVTTLSVAGDTLTSIAYRLVDAIAANSVLQKFGISATVNIVSSNPVITISWPGPVGNFTAVSGVSGASSVAVLFAGTVVTGDNLSLSVGSGTLPLTSGVITVGGTAVTGDVVTASFFNQSLTDGVGTAVFTVASTQTLAAIATGLATAINASAALTALGMSANATANNVYITWSAAYGPIGMSVAATRAATETIALVSQAGNPPSALAPSPAPSELITLGGSVTTGDVLTLFISASGAKQGKGPVPVAYTVLNTDTTLTILAASIAAAINSSPALASTFTATSALAVITVVWQQTAGNVSFLSSVAGVPTEYANVTRPAQTVAIPYTTVGGDSATTIATAFKNAVNANVILQATGAGVTASSSTGTLTLDYNGGLNPVTFKGSINGVETATFGGSITANDVLTLTITDASLPGGTPIALTHTVLSTDTTTTLATAFKALINANVSLANTGITATSSAAILSITSASKTQTTYANTLSVGATETITLANTATETITITPTIPVQIVTVGGSITVGDTLNVTVTDPAIEGGSATVEYTTVTTGTTSTAATGLATALAESDLLAQAGFTASASGAVVTLTPPEPDSTPALTTWANGAAKTLTLTGSVTTGDVVNVKFTNAKLAGGAQNLQYAALVTDTSLTILAASIASAINADANLAPAGITATSALGVVSIKWAEAAGTMTFAANANGVETLTLTGSVTTGDSITVTVTDASVAGSPLAVNYIALSTDTTVTILAASLAVVLQGTAALTAAGITTTSALGVVKIKSDSVTATTYTRTIVGTVVGTLGGGPTESTALAGGPTETLAVTNPTAGSEVLTATTPLAGGAGPIVPTSNFTFLQPTANGGSYRALTMFYAGKPVIPGWNMINDLIVQQQPII